MFLLLQAQAEARTLAEEKCTTLAQAKSDLELQLASMEIRDKALQEGVLHLESVNARTTQDLVLAQKAREAALSEVKALREEVAIEATNRGRAESALRHFRLDYDQVWSYGEGR
jgi:peptidoglycan hydrolase CwlO-like protein